MSEFTHNLKLLKKDPAADAADTFNIQTMLNDNWDKLDAFAGAAPRIFTGTYIGTGAFAVPGQAPAASQINRIELPGGFWPALLVLICANGQDMLAGGVVMANRELTTAVRATSGAVATWDMEFYEDSVTWFISAYGRKSGSGSATAYDQFNAAGETYAYFLIGGVHDEHA